MSTTTQPTPIFRRDYRPPSFLIEHTALRFELAEDRTLVRATLDLRRNPEAEAQSTLVLDGEDLELLEIRINGNSLNNDQYSVQGDKIILHNPEERFELETLVCIYPHRNTKLSGLYKSSDTFCTQCEAEGFRRITYYLDRPDVMSKFTTTIVADPKRFPVLLSNGNRVLMHELPDGRCEVVWEDPHPKPSYLFALVAGNLACLRDSFTTQSGRNVALEIWVPSADLDSCDYAMASLKQAMRWDEERFGLEYDLDIYMIVAVSDFNMGAMENKGLNIFNTKYVLARPDTATDDDFEGVAGVIAHEYFHNWTGNRVTCRDWFQLTLKEGLTVYRDASFTADHGSPAVKRIRDVRKLRMLQFPEDAGPMAHPIRPESYIEMNNFYTMTVYEKGAEVVGMYETLLGRQGFRKGMDLYFERHDGQAVTCDDFRQAMADANGVDLELFERWYSDAGTPTLSAKGRFDPQAKTYTLTLKQSGPKQSNKAPYRARHLPVAIGLLDPTGKDIEPASLPPHCRVSDQAGTLLVELQELEQSFTFGGIQAAPIPSILRNFSAPVTLELDQSDDELAFLMAHDSDPFNRWDAGQRLARGVLLGLVGDVQKGRKLQFPNVITDAFAKVLQDNAADASLRALALSLPDEGQIGQAMAVVDPDAIHQARRFAAQSLSAKLSDAWHSIHESLAPSGPYIATAEEISRRRLRNVALSYICAHDENLGAKLALKQYYAADNMTDAQAALVCLSGMESEARTEALQHFYERWRSHALVIDKWFAIQSAANRPNALDRAIALADHTDFTQRNPNRFRALIGTFGQNQIAFHDASGRGYEFVATQVMAADSINPQVAARTVSAFNSWKRFDTNRQSLILAQLERIAKHPGLSKDVYEIVSKSLSAAEQS